MKEWQKTLGADTFTIGAYCSPQPACVKYDRKYPSKITEEVYGMLADLGVTLVYGHAETIGGGNESEVFKALDLCEKVGIKYLVRDMIAERYVSPGFRDLPDFRSLDEKARKELDEAFLKSLERYINHPACAGISFYDEPGIVSFEGIGAAYRVFKKVYPDKLFYVNLSPNNISSEQLEFGSHYASCAKSVIPEIKIGITNDLRYEYYLKRYFATHTPDVVSYDSYPLTTLGGVETVIHNTLWEIQQIVNVFSKKYGVPYWNFIQVGGKWDGWYRIADYSEMLLQINLTVAYGAKGIELFPCVYPNDFIMENQTELYCGVIDQYGKPTDYYHWLKVIFKQIKAIQRYIMNAEFVCSVKAGDYAGLLPPREEIEKIPYNEVIYDGKLPVYGNVNREKYGCLIKAEATSQVFIGCFESDGKDMFYAVNNSICSALNLKLFFDGEYEFIVVKNGIEKTVCGSELYFQRLAAGDGILVKIK